MRWNRIKRVQNRLEYRKEDELCILFYETSVLIVWVWKPCILDHNISFLLRSVSEKFENYGFHFIVSQTPFSGSSASELP